MKRAAPWEKEAESVSSSDSSDSESEDDGPGSGKIKKKDATLQMAKDITINAADPVKKRSVLDYTALSRHGYGGGLSVLRVPPPRMEEREQDWSWSKGKPEDAKAEESFEERERTRAAIAAGEQLLNVQKNQPMTRKEKNATFSQKEKRKRDLGQASRGKSYVEEEKRLLRDSGVYSGFDS